MHQLRSNNHLPTFKPFKNLFSLGIINSCWSLTLILNVNNFQCCTLLQSSSFTDTWLNKINENKVNVKPLIYLTMVYMSRSANEDPPNFHLRSAVMKLILKFTDKVGSDDYSLIDSEQNKKVKVNRQLMS